MKIFTHVDGVPVLTQSEAYGTHPRWRDKQVAFSGITHLILEDERELYACNDCGYTRDTIQGVVAHMSSHGRQPGPLYPASTIKAVIREVLRHDDKRNKCELAAAALNHKGVETLNGEKWYASTVSGLYRRYKDDPEYKVRRPRRPIKLVQSPPPVEAETSDEPIIVKQSPSESKILTNEPLVRRLREFGEKLQDLVVEHEQLTNDVVIAIGETNIDPEIFEKAEKYDALAKMFPAK